MGGELAVGVDCWVRESQHALQRANRQAGFSAGLCRAHSKLWKGSNRTGGIRILLASTLSFRTVGPATILSHKLCAATACQYIVGSSRGGNIVVWSRSPRKCRYLLFAYPLFKHAPLCFHPHPVDQRQLKVAPTRSSAHVTLERWWRHKRDLTE